MSFRILFLFTFISITGFTQDEKPKPVFVRTYWDYHSTLIQSEGYQRKSGAIRGAEKFKSTVERAVIEVDE